MSNPDVKLRQNAANAKANHLGYRIEVDFLLASRLHAAYAVSNAGDTGRRFLCSSHAGALEALEEGAEILRGVVEDGRPWPGAASP
jgi:hypothetical protein